MTRGIWRRKTDVKQKVTTLSDKFDRALLYARHVHGSQSRKGTTVPYIAHLLAVAATVLEYGGLEELEDVGQALLRGPRECTL